MSRPSLPERLVKHVHELERLAEAKKDAAGELAAAFEAAQIDGFDVTTLRVVLKLRGMSAHERRSRRALEAIYMGALGMLDGEALPEVARRRLDGRPDDAPSPPSGGTGQPAPAPKSRHRTLEPAPSKKRQRTLALKTPDEARRDGGEAAKAGKRIYDNPFPAGDPCRAAWDEGWCAQRKSHGMDLPEAYQRRTEKPADEKDTDGTPDDDNGKGTTK